MSLSFTNIIIIVIIDSLFNFLAVVLCCGQIQIQRPQAPPSFQQVKKAKGAWEQGYIRFTLHQSIGYNSSMTATKQCLHAGLFSLANPNLGLFCEI